MRIRILGAGIAGLASAVAMRCRCGFDDVIVLERNSPGQAQVRTGHGLILMQNGVAALRALGTDGFLTRYRAIDRALFQDQNGLVLRSQQMDGTYCVTHAAISNALRAAIPEESVEYGRRCRSIDLIPRLPAGGDPRTIRRHIRSIHFDGGTPLTDQDADLFIGADGWRSVMHAEFNPEDARTPSPVCEIVTSTLMPNLAAQLGSVFLKTIFVGHGLAFGLLAPTPDQVIGFLQFDSERYGLPGQTMPSDLESFIHRLVGRAPEPVATYLLGANYVTAHLWRPANAEVAKGLCGDNAVIIGDAAHPLLPFTSQGVGAGLEDAVMLADVLLPVGDELGLLPRALAGFARDRTADLAGFVEGGRRILASFVGVGAEFVPPYIGGEVSRLAQHLALPPTGLRSLCQLFDLDGDGHLTQEEFRQAFNPILEEGGVAAQGEDLFGALDTDHDGFIDVEELLAAIAGGDEASPVLWEIRRMLTPRRIGRYALSHRVRAAFRTSDADGDGVMDFPQFATVISLFGVIGGEADLRGLFDSVDADADGQIEESELLEAVRQAPSQRTCGKDVEEDALFSNASVNVSALRRRAYNHRWAVHASDVIPLSAADSDFPVSAEIVSAVQQYLGSGYVSYGPAEGLPEFRRIAAETMRMRHGLDCDPDAVFPTNGAASALFLVARLAITSPGEEAIIPDPVDFLLYRSVQAAGGVVKRLPYRLGTFDLAELESLITPQTRLISLCNPHNPLGRVLRRDELEDLAAVAMRNNLWILSDEVWSDIVYPPNKHISIATLDRRVAERTFTVFGFSKSYGLAGMRLGLLVTPNSAQRDRILRLSHANETAYGVSTVSQVAGAAAYELAGAWLGRFVAHLRSQRDYAVDRLNAIPDVRCQTPEGTYVVFPDVSRLAVDQDVLADLLLKRHRVAVIPGSRSFFGPGAEGHVRLTLATSRAILAEGLDRLEQGIHSLSGTTRVS